MIFFKQQRTQGQWKWQQQARCCWMVCKPLQESRSSVTLAWITSGSASLSWMELEWGQLKWCPAVSEAPQNGKQVLTFAGLQTKNTILCQQLWNHAQNWFLTVHLILHWWSLEQTPPQITLQTVSTSKAQSYSLCKCWRADGRKKHVQ